MKLQFVAAALAGLFLLGCTAQTTTPAGAGATTTPPPTGADGSTGAVLECLAQGAETEPIRDKDWRKLSTFEECAAGTEYCVQVLMEDPDDGKFYITGGCLGALQGQAAIDEAALATDPAGLSCEYDMQGKTYNIPFMGVGDNMNVTVRCCTDSRCNSCKAFAPIEIADGATDQTMLSRRHHTRKQGRSRATKAQSKPRRSLQQVRRNGNFTCYKEQAEVACTQGEAFCWSTRNSSASSAAWLPQGCFNATLADLTCPVNGNATISTAGAFLDLEGMCCASSLCNTVDFVAPAEGEGEDEQEEEEEEEAAADLEQYRCDNQLTNDVTPLPVMTVVVLALIVIPSLAMGALVDYARIEK